MRATTEASSHHHNVPLGKLGEGNSRGAVQRTAHLHLHFIQTVIPILPGRQAGMVAGGDHDSTVKVIPVEAEVLWVALAEAEFLDTTSGTASRSRVTSAWVSSLGGPSCAAETSSARASGRAFD